MCFRSAGALELDMCELSWDLPLISCVAFGKLLNFSKLWFPHLHNGTNYTLLKHLL